MNKFKENDWVIADYNQDNKWYVGAIKKVENAKQFQVIFLDKPANSLEIERIRPFDDWIYEDINFPCIVKDINGIIFTITKVNKELKEVTGNYIQDSKSIVVLPFKQIYLEIENKDNA